MPTGNTAIATNTALMFRPTVVSAIKTPTTIPAQRVIFPTVTPRQDNDGTPVPESSRNGLRKKSNNVPSISHPNLSSSWCSSPFVRLRFPKPFSRRFLRVTSFWISDAAALRYRLRGFPRT
jgi:hypothetical protein